MAFPVAGQTPALPANPDSVRFAVIGDTGTGGRAQYDVANRMVESRQKFPFDFVIMVGDNVYGREGPIDMQKKFEVPYRPLIDKGVKFYAALGNHDDTNQRHYEFFNMNGKQYYTFKKGNVHFFALNSNYMDREQLAWLEKELEASGSDWKICYFHHPLYSSGRAHGSTTELRLLLEPIFIKHGVQVVFQGHEHNYERIKPQKGIHYFTEGASGKLKKNNLAKTDLTAAGFDKDQTFMLVEITGDDLHFQTLSRTGVIVDSGVIRRPSNAQAAVPAFGRTLLGPAQSAVTDSVLHRRKALHLVDFQRPELGSL
ncbi:MAG: metallophosphoesterase family protein [Terriglobales bacterium]